MKYWKNITIAIPGVDLRNVIDQISELNIISLSIQNAKSNKKPDWFHFFDKPLEMNGDTHSISLLLDANVSSMDIIEKIKNLLKLDEVKIIDKKIIKDKDWVLHSQTKFQGIKISKTLQILPPWIKIKNQTLKNIIINPGNGFGTGSHPTTRMVLNWIENNNIKNKSLIDYGSGSGIICIASKLFGADYVVGAEIDSKAIANATQNCSINNVNIPFFDLNKRTIKGKFDVVVANILSSTLIKLSENFKELTQETLILSGILNRQVTEVICTYSKWINLKVKKKNEGWNLLEGKL